MPEAHHIPGSDLPVRLSDVLTDRPLAGYCGSGYRNVCNMIGGFSAREAARMRRDARSCRHGHAMLRQAPSAPDNHRSGQKNEAGQVTLTGGRDAGISGKFRQEPLCGQLPACARVICPGLPPAIPPHIKTFPDGSVLWFKFERCELSLVNPVILIRVDAIPLTGHFGVPPDLFLAQIAIAVRVQLTE